MFLMDNHVFWIKDKYVGLFKINSGGMGEVWAGKSIGDQGFHVNIAIKRLLQQQQDNEEYLRALINEAKTLQHLSYCPNLVRVIDLCVEQGFPHIIMEYIDGPELRDILNQLTQQNKTLPIRLVFYIIDEIAKGLVHVHNATHHETGKALNIIHRDISPSNILITSQGHIKITDFGIAKSTLQSSVTRQGEIKGKFKYMSPEQANGKSLSFQTDYYSLGLTFFECLLGFSSYQSDTDAGIIKCAQDATIHYPDDLDSALRDILNKLLFKKPGDRYSSLDIFRKELGEVALYYDGIGTSYDLQKFLCKLENKSWIRAKEFSSLLSQSNEIPSKQLKIPDNINLETVVYKKKSYVKMIIGIIILSMISGVAVYQFFQRKEREKKVEVITQKKEKPVEGNEVKKSSSPVKKKSQIIRGKLKIRSSEEDTQIHIHYENRKIEMTSPAYLTMLPLNKPIKIEAVKDGFYSKQSIVYLNKQKSVKDVTVKLKPIPDAYVQFLSKPAAIVEIPELQRDYDSPSPMIQLKPGVYSIVYKSNLTSQRARTTLNVQDGGSFICHANMQIDMITQTPTGKNATAACKKR